NRSRTDSAIISGLSQPATPAAALPASPSRDSTPAVVQVGAAPATASRALPRLLNFSFIVPPRPLFVSRPSLPHLEPLHLDGPGLFGRPLQERRPVPPPPLQPAGDAQLLPALDRLAQPGECLLLLLLAFFGLLEDEELVRTRYPHDDPFLLDRRRAD